jgi:hypothetical protein
MISGLFKRVMPLKRGNVWTNLSGMAGAGRDILIPNLAKVMRLIRLKLAEVAALAGERMQPEQDRAIATVAIPSPTMLQVRKNARRHGGHETENSYHVES